jgi:hypothetical protein
MFQEITQTARMGIFIAVIAVVIVAVGGLVLMVRHRQGQRQGH